MPVTSMPADATLHEEEIRTLLRRWIREHAGEKFERELTDDLPLLDSGVLSSLDVTELILFCEQIRGAEVEVELIEPGLLESIDTLYAGLFGSVPA